MTDPSVTEQDARRAELIADLRAFADWLEQNPWLPLPSTIEAREHLNGATDADPAATLARLRDIAQRTDGEVDESLTDRTRVAVNIGRVEYRLLAWHPKGRPGEPDPKDAEIERLRAELAEARAAADPDYGRTTAVAEAKPDTLGFAVTGRAAVPVTTYFSFGHGQTDPDTGENLLDKYVTVIAPTYEACREAMFASRYGQAWSFDYPAGTPTADKWIPQWTEHERIVVDSAAVPDMQTRPQCRPQCSPQCLTAYALKSIAFNQHLDGCPNAVSRPDSAVISPAAES